MPCHNGGVVYFFAPKNRRKRRKGSALDPNEDIVSMGVCSPFIRPLISLYSFKVIFNQSLRRRFSFSFIVWRYPTTQKVLVVTQFFLCYAHSRGEGFVRKGSYSATNKKFAQTLFSNWFNVSHT